jgi:glycosyltransferase involved in cell wall biosynthesis
LTDTRIAILSPLKWRKPISGAEARVLAIVSELKLVASTIDVYVQENTENLRIDDVNVYKWTRPWRDEDSYPTSIHKTILFASRSLHVLRSISKLPKYDIVISELLMSAWDGIVLSSFRGSYSILDERNVEWELQTQLGSVSKHSWRNLRVYERFCCDRFDAVLTTSSVDRSELLKLGIDESRLAIVPNGVDCKVYKREEELGAKVKATHNLQSKRVILYMGHYGYFPNVDAVNTIVRQIYPETSNVQKTRYSLLLDRNLTAYNFLRIGTSL